MAKTVSHAHIYEYIDDRLRSAYLYFGNPQTKTGALLTLGDISQLRKKLQDNLKHMHDLSQNSIPSPESSTGTDLIKKDKETKESTYISQKKSISTPLSEKFEDFADRIGKSVLNSAISAVSNNFHPKTTLDGINDKSDGERLENCISSLTIKDSNECSVEVTKPRASSSDSGSEHSENEESVDSGDSGESEESRDLRDDKNLKEVEKSSEERKDDNGGIRGLYDESLLDGLQEDDFSYRFDEEVLYDGKVLEIKGLSPQYQLQQSTFCLKILHLNVFFFSLYNFIS